MIPLSSAISGGLTWTKWKRGDEIRVNGSAVGTLQKTSFWSSSFLAEIENEKWTFRPAGFFCTGAEIVNPASAQPVATFKSPWGGKGTLTFADGQTFLFESRGWWRPVWSVTTEAGQPVLSLRIREKTAEVAAGSGVPDERLLLLMMFTLYRVRKAEEDAASAATVAVIAGT